MSVKLHHQSFISPSSSKPWLSRKPISIRILNRTAFVLDHLWYKQGNIRKRCRKRLSLLEVGDLSLSCRLVDFRKPCLAFPKSRRIGHLLPFASADDGVTVNGTSQASTPNPVDEMRIKLDETLEGEDYSNGLVQSLHDAARVFELAIKEQSSLSKMSWFSTVWLGVDKNAWVKALSYQASVYSILQAASEISSRGDGRDRDINVFVQKSLLRQSAPLESVIREKLSAKQPEAYDWFWSEQVPVVVTSFVNHFEKDQRFAAATAVCGKRVSLSSGNASDISLLMLALSCIAAITKLGPTKVYCAQFFSMIPDVTGRLMDMLVEFIPIRQAYHSIKDIGLRREFLVHFGPRAAACRVKNDQGIEVIFWVGLLQKQLQRAIDRERIWSRLTTCESIEVLERDLAIFGFFIALGRSTQSFLYANGFEALDEPIEGFVRYLIGGSVLYYPQLSSISSYQLYVEVVCEELDWLPFYPGISNTSKRSHHHKSKMASPPNAEAIPIVLDVCSHWLQSFIKYSRWLEKPFSVKAARFLSRGHNKLRECTEELGMQKKLIESTARTCVERTDSVTYSPARKEPDSFDKDQTITAAAPSSQTIVATVPSFLVRRSTVVLFLARWSETKTTAASPSSLVQALESVEEALLRLEELLQELHLSSSSSGKEHLKAACSDLESIRKLKKEAEFLEASFRAKAASLQRESDDDNHSPSSISKQRQYSGPKDRKSASTKIDGRSRVVSNPRGLWSFLVRHPGGKSEPGISTADGSCDDPFEEATVGNEIQRFELLRTELIELEKRVQKSTDRSENEEEEIQMTGETASYNNEVESIKLVQVQKKENIIEKSLDKLKGTTTDVWQGTQLLAIDVTAAMVLLRRVLIGDELTEKEKQALRRTLTDLASVVPIGFLMLLPVTAVGHAAMLAAIQRYVPALIPSTYGSERLDLLRQLEKVKEMETSEVNSNENSEELPE